MKSIKSLFALSNRGKDANQRGDTLIEVMLAISILGIVSVTTMSIMNRSTLQIMDTLERTAVRSDINSQIELLNYTRDHYQSSTAWSGIVGKSTTSTAAVDNADSCTPTSNSFYLTQDGDGVKVNSNSINKNAGGRATPGNGIWIDAIYTSSAPIPYYSFHVKACWTRAGDNHVTASSSTVARIYDSSVPVVINPAPDFTVSNSATSLATATFSWGAITCPTGTTFSKQTWTMVSKDPVAGMSSQSGTINDQWTRQVSFSTVTPGYYYDFTVKAECRNSSTGAITTLTSNTIHHGHPFTAQSNVPQLPNVGVSPSSGSGNRTIQLNSSCAGTKTNLVFQYRVNGGEWLGPYTSTNGSNYSLTWTPPGKGTYTFEARSQCQTSSLAAGPIDGWTFDSAWTSVSSSVSTVVN